MVNQRNILVVAAHGPARIPSMQRGARVCAQLRDAGVTAVIAPQETDDVGAPTPNNSPACRGSGRQT